MAFTKTWNEATPAGADDMSQGDNEIRDLKFSMRERLAVDHHFLASESGTQIGMHKWVTFIEIADIGTGAAGQPILGAQTVSGKPELVYTDEDDNDVQITSAGKLLAVLLTGGQTVAGVKTFSSFPISPSAAPTTNYQFANKKYCDDNFAAGTHAASHQNGGGDEISLADLSGAPADTVNKTGNQSVAGIKTFSSFGITPSSAPTTNYQWSNKKYVDDNVSAFGSWVDESAKVGNPGTNVQAATDGFVVLVAHAGGAGGGEGRWEGFTDASATPTTRRGGVTPGAGETEEYASFTMPVKKGEYWRVDRTVGSSDETCYWIPLGS